MGILNKLFSSGESSKEPQKQLPWKQLTAISQLDEIDLISRSKPVAVFKHSTRCGISSMVLNQFEREYDLEDESVELYYLDLLNHRDISDEIAARYGVFHQSPQLLVVKNGAAVHDASHNSIDAGTIKKFATE